MVAQKSPMKKQSSSKGLRQTTILPKITLKTKPGPEEEEEAPIEEQFILRVPGEAGTKFREAVKAREIPEDYAVVFTDPRRAVFRMGDDKYAAKLVDLPCIIESHKTFDNKQFYKIADISQMLVVEGPAPEPSAPPPPPLHHDEYTWPHGLTPPLYNVRKRRFRKRINKRTIEDVEREVIRLLEADAEAEHVWFEVDDGTDRAIMEEEGEEEEDAEGSVEEDQDGGTTMDIDEDDEFAAAWEEAAAEHALEADEAEAEGDEQASEEDEESEDEDEDEDEEPSEGEQARDIDKEQLHQKSEELLGEIRDLEAKIEDNRAKLSVQINPIMRKRFEDSVARLETQLQAKRAELADVQSNLT